MNYFINTYKCNYANFNGRARRAEYWMTYLFYMIFYVVLLVIGTVLSNVASIFAFLPVVFALASICPMLALSIRRMHDIGKSGWWLFISLVPCIGSIVLLVFLCKDSEAGENQYGPNPKGF